MSEWSPIKTAPKDGRYVLVYARSSGKMEVFQAKWHQPGNPERPGFWTSPFRTARHPSHWRPLPEPPEKEKR